MENNLAYIPVYRKSQNNLTPEQARDQEQFRAFEIDDTWINEEERTIIIPVSSEFRVRRWWSDEILGHDTENVDLSRIRGVGSFLFAHGRDPNYGVVPLGPINKTWLKSEERKLWAVLKFDESEESERLFKKVKQKSLKGISIGYAVDKWVKIGKDEIYKGHEGPAYYAEKWSPYEISLEPTPADPDVGGRSEVNQNERNETNMGEETKTEQVLDVNEEEVRKQTEVVDPKERNAQIEEKTVREDAVKEERARVAEITSMCRNFEFDPKELIEKGSSVEDARKIVLSKLAKERAAIPVATVTQDRKENLRSAISDSLAMRAGVVVENPVEGSNDFRGYGLFELAREICEKNDINTRGLSRLDLAERAIFGTSDFPAILADVANKTMMKAYTEVPTTYQHWTKDVEASDFKEMHRVQLSEAPDLDIITESGEYKHAKFSETEEKYKLLTYGKKFALSRKAIINDDLSALTRIPRLFGAAAARKANQLVYSIITNSPNMADGNALFHANHKNTLATGTALSIESLGKARALMRKQKGLGNKAILNIVPKYLIIPAELETSAEQLIKSLVDPTKANATPNPFANKLQIIVDAILDEDSIEAWYLVADYNQVDTIEVAFLNGQKAPLLESRQGWDVDGMEFKVRIDVAAKAIDWRGLYKNPGA